MWSGSPGEAQFPGLKALVGIPSLEEIDAIVADETNDPVLLGQPSRPDIRAQVPQGFRLSQPGAGVSHDGLDERRGLESDASILFDPVSKVLSELVLKNAVLTSRDDDGKPPRPDRIRAGQSRGSAAQRYGTWHEPALREGARRFAGTGGDGPSPGGCSAQQPRSEPRLVPRGGE